MCKVRTDRTRSPPCRGSRGKLPQPAAMNSDGPRRSVSFVGAMAGDAGAEPVVVVGRRQGDDLERHQRMRPAAIFRALAAIDAGAFGGEPQPRRTRPGIMSTLPPRLGTQKLWITSAASGELHRTPGRDRDFVRARHRRRAGIGDAPPPLLAGHFDVSKRIAVGADVSAASARRRNRAITSASRRERSVRARRWILSARIARNRGSPRIASQVAAMTTASTTAASKNKIQASVAIWPACGPCGGKDGLKDLVDRARVAEAATTDAT